MATPTSNYHDTVRGVYRDAALRPAADLCCVPQPARGLPGLVVPDEMHEMNYGCGSTVHLQDMRQGQTALYVGVGGGLEALELAYFCRAAGAVIAVDPVAEMRAAAARNLARAAEANAWFDQGMVDIRDGDALSLPVGDESVDFAAQNCLFNIFKVGGDLERALAEVFRVLRPGGRLVMSDPVTPRPLPERLADDPRLRAECLSGCLTLDAYLKMIVDAGFGAVEVRSRRPYRVLDAAGYGLTQDLLLETVEVAALKVPVDKDGPCIFTGRTATYTGPEAAYDDGAGHVLRKNTPTAVCDKTAAALTARGRQDLLLTAPTWHYAGGGCC